MQEFLGFWAVRFTQILFIELLDRFIVVRFSSAAAFILFVEAFGAL
jgi:hypothetical protein